MIFFNDYLNNNLLVIILVVSLVTMFIAGISATLETDFKKIVAFSTLSQIGILFFMLSVNKKTICLFHLYSHAFFKRILFIGVGVVLHTSISSQEARDMLKSRAGRAVRVICISVSALNLIGIFFLGGFFSKDIFLMLSFSSLINFIFLVILFSILTLTFFYSIKMVFYIMGMSKKNNKDISGLVVIPQSILMIFSCVIGVFYLSNIKILKEMRIIGPMT